MVAGLIGFGFVVSNVSKGASGLTFGIILICGAIFFTYIKCKSKK